MWIVSLSWSGTRAQLVKFAARIRAIRQSGIIILPTNAEPLPATLLTRSWLGTANLNARFLFATSDIIGVKSCLFNEDSVLVPRFEYRASKFAFTLAYLFLSRPPRCSVPRNLPETTPFQHQREIMERRRGIAYRHLYKLIIGSRRFDLPPLRATRGKVNLLCASISRFYSALI